MIRIWLPITLLLWASVNSALAGDNRQIVHASEVKWEALNPARGENSPRAGTLWGDRNGNEPTGFLAKFKDGFSSPPHIHNTTYRAVVIHGSIHNDDPNAAAMWMPTGSFWTQPSGEAHITAAKGSINMALVEIDHGPYRVLPLEQIYDNGERPINIHASNIIWVDQPRQAAAANSPKIAYLWGSLEEGQSNGTFIKLPAGFNGQILSHGAIFRAVVISGQLGYQAENIKPLEPGSYFSSKGKTAHLISSDVKKETIIYVRTNGIYEVVPLK